MRPFSLLSRVPLQALLLAFLWAGCTATQPRETVPAPTPAPAAADVPMLSSGVASNWFHHDPERDDYPGISTDRAYAELLNGRQPQRTVVVAVLDSGVDIEHEDLQGHIWTNDDEVAGNGQDDDGNGYVDDVHGWSFLGSAAGDNMQYDTYELTREYARLEARFADKTLAEVPESQNADYQYYLELKEDYETARREAQDNYTNIAGFLGAVQQATSVLSEHFGNDTYAEADVRGIGDTDPQLAQARDIMAFLYDNAITEQDLRDYFTQLEADVQYRYDPTYDARSIVGDDPNDPNQRIYGNTDVAGPNPEHGTHVAGIIAALRDNALGAQGVAHAVEIMSVRTVPEGDERDKDVANAIRYAVDNGAHIINMSFGKAYSPHKDVVDAAVRYAEAQGVLLVHGSGNDGEDLDDANNFPNRTFGDGGQATNWLEIGASNWDADGHLAADFSNYGDESVDIFAPGVDIYSTLPGSVYGDRDGTSMASPVVAGLAAVLMAYYPELTAAQVRDIILQSGRSYADLEVRAPGQEERMVSFGSLSTTGRVVNLYSALQMAAEQAGQ